MDKNIKNRLIYLAEKFDIFNEEELSEILSSNSSSDSPVNVYPINNHKNETIALKFVYLPTEEKKRVSIKITISEKLFALALNTDPTENKIFVQWILNSFTRLIKDDDDIKGAIRFVDEDLIQAKKYLLLFESNKRKQKFRDWAIKNEKLKWKRNNPFENELEWDNLKYDPSDINRYKDLSQLFDAVDPFIERSSSDLERAMNRFVNLNEAEIPYRSRKYTLYIPLTTEASCIFENFAGWCTARKDNSMFRNYTINYPILDNIKSKIYIIVDNKLFENKSKNCYQVHFESGQIKNQSNGNNIDLYSEVLEHDEGLREYFKYELENKIKIGNSKYKNKYSDYLISFGYTDFLFNLLDSQIPIIYMTEKRIPKIPDLSKFVNLDEFVLQNVGLKELHPSIGNLNKLEILGVPDNKLTKLPKEIGNLKNLIFLNIKGNHIEEFPDEITLLDSSNGGNLYSIALNKKDISEENFNKLKRLLPNVLLYF